MDRFDHPCVLLNRGDRMDRFDHPCVLLNRGDRMDRFDYPCVLLQSYLHVHTCTLCSGFSF
jgi:hypothetical protein